MKTNDSNLISIPDKKTGMSGLIFIQLIALIPINLLAENVIGTRIFKEIWYFLF